MYAGTCRHRIPPPRIRQGDSRIEVRSRYWPESQDQCYEHGSGCQSIGEQGDSYVAGSQPFPHDSRAHHRRK